MTNGGRSCGSLDHWATSHPCHRNLTAFLRRAALKNILDATVITVCKQQRTKGQISAHCLTATATADGRDERCGCSNQPRHRV